DHPDDLGTRRTERRPNAQLASPFADAPRQHSVDPGGGEGEGGQGEYLEERERKAALSGRTRDQVAHGRNADDRLARIDGPHGPLDRGSQQRGRAAAP